MGTIPLHKRNPWAPNAKYDRKTRAAIIKAKLIKELCPGGRKPTDISKDALLNSAAVFILELRDVEDAYAQGKPLPKNYLSLQQRLLACLDRLKPKGSRGRNPKASQTNGEGLDLHSIVNSRVAGGTRD